jgi:phenylpropionate dioxygenase-like ring-hydroxylating dioxygenase large terminal subunit
MNLVQKTRVHGSVYTDRAIFDDEMEKIYYNGWVFVAHESEIPNKNDFCTRNVGRQSLIITRDAAGKINVMYNRCSHRGAAVCSVPSGNQPMLSCPYHAWTFGLDGKLIGVPAKGAYPDSFDQNAHGLAIVTAVESYRGFIFVNLGDNPVPLTDFLGKAAGLIDDLVDMSPEGEIFLSAGWMKHRLRSNWKMIVENVVDGYHAPAVHGSLLRANKNWADIRDRKPTSPTRVRDFGMGHTDIDHATDYRMAGDRMFRWTGGPPESRFPDYIAAMTKAYGKEKAKRKLVEGPPHAMLFPNFSLAEMTIMAVQPISESESIWLSTPVFLKGADELNERTLRRCEGAIGPAGLLIADDCEISEINQTGVANRKPEWLELSRGVSTEECEPDGTLVAGLMDETSIRGFWRHYRDVMSRGRA